MRRDDRNEREGARTGGEDTRTPDHMESRADHQRAQRNRIIKVVAILALAAIIISFVASNSQGTTVHYVFFTRRPPLIWVMFACAVLGGVVGYLIGKPGRQIGERRKPEDRKDQSKG